MSSPERISKLVQSMLDHADATYPDRAHRIWEIWHEAVGEDVARRTQPLNFYRGRLTVGVSSAPWMQQLQLLGEQISATLNQKLEAEVVTSIRFHVAHLKPVATPPTDPGTPWESLPLSKQEIEKIEASTAEVKNPDLRQSIRDAQLMAKRREQFMKDPEGSAPRPNTSSRPLDREESAEE